MYSRLLVPLDGSKLAEQALPFARYLAKALAIPADLLQAIDPESLQALANPQQGRYIDTLLADKNASSRTYLKTIAASFNGARITSTVENGKAEDLIIDKAAVDKEALIVMATHGRSGIQRWLLGSIADKVCTDRPMTCCSFAPPTRAKRMEKLRSRKSSCHSMARRWRRRYCPTSST